MQKGDKVLGIEGTAWNLSAAVFGDGLISLYSKPYRPAHGGIHPREAAQHHASEMREVIASVLTNPGEIGGVAFSQGPGLGPCLRTVATAARALALALDVPLVGVNHCVAHVEIGRWATGCVDPITLYTSGANTQVLGYLNGRYRIFGETLDIGLGNGLDKFARSKGFPHPGGPKIEALARGGEYIHLPYTVKGMDLAFSGLISAAQESTAPIEDVCHSLQETAFAMCVEVTERALAQTGKDEVLLVGGVAANTRLREMLQTMCEERGAKLFVPEPQFCGDNGAMIAYTGKVMLEAGATLPLEASRANSHYRPDEVEVVWRKDEVKHEPEGGHRRGAEAIVTIGEEAVTKRRVSKSYRVTPLDASLIAERTRAEARLIAAARKAGVATPIIFDVSEDMITMERVDGVLLRDTPTSESLARAGVAVGRLHGAGIVHGDLTTSNMIERDGRCVLIDFGLAHMSTEVEDQGVDLHVLFQTLESTTGNPTELKESFLRGYASAFPGAAAAARREHEVELRGRYL